MIAVPFDTLSIAKRLQSKGFSQQQAEGFAMEMQEASQEDHLVTKDYLDEKLGITRSYLDNQLEKMELRLTIKTGAMLFVGFGFLAGIKFFGA